MAKSKKSKDSGSIPGSLNQFSKGLNTDVRDFHLDKKSWIRARNAINNSHIGDLYSIGNEPSNKFCSSAPYRIIGAIHMEGSLWWLFSGNDLSGSEIGIFDENKCTYELVVNNRCLGFRSTHPISGSSRATWDCSDRVYWQDNLNPDRTLDRSDVPWIQDCEPEPSNPACIICVDTDVLDCDKIRLEIFMLPPCPTIKQGPSGGTVLNGSYYVHIAYMIDSQRVTDYFPKSNVVHIFEHDQANASLEITIEDLDTNNFDQYELILVQFITSKLSVKQIGIYSTNQDKVTIDLVDPTLESVDPDLLIITNPIADKSEGIFNVGKYLFRTGITGKFDFNYQPLANQITTKWQLVEYPEDYYRKGGYNVGYMRDEVYSYFIRFRYRTGDLTPSYHIPGREAELYDIPTAPPGPAIQMLESDPYLVVEDNNIEEEQGLTSKVFEMFNTASGTALVPSVVQDDGGILLAEGEMGYWESDEFYPDRTPEIWNASSHDWSATGDEAHDLCGLRIRHHRFPENSLYAGTTASGLTNHYVTATKTIRVMGVAFENIQPPVDNDGIAIPGIIGYEILRGSRDGNRTVLYKGLLNNMRMYANPSEITSRIGLYPNYPYNSTSASYPDLFNSIAETSFEPLSGNTNIYGNRYNDYIPNSAISKKHFTFHSPDTMFNKPFLGQKELKFSGIAYGKAEASYLEVNDHPKHVFVTDLAYIVATIVGVGYAIAKFVGTVDQSWGRPTFYQYPRIVGALGGISPYRAGITSTISNTSGGGTLTNTLDAGMTTAESTRQNILNFLDGLSGGNSGKAAEESAYDITKTGNTVGKGITSGGGEILYRDKNQTPNTLRLFSSIPTFVGDLTDGADLMLDIIRKASGPKQFALQYQAYCGFESFTTPYRDCRRRLIDEAVYLSGHLQNFKDTHRINNILRAKTVTLNTTNDVSNIVGTGIEDNSMNKIRISDLGYEVSPTGVPLYNKARGLKGFTRTASSHYVAFKSRLRSQYGQVYSIQQLPASDCIIPLSNTSTGIIFGGDTYIGRYQEKNTFYHFYQWLLGQKNRTEFNYHLYDTVQHTAFWMDTEPFDTIEFFNSIPAGIAGAIGGGGGGGLTGFFQSLVTPSDKACFDKLHAYSNSNGGIFTTKNSYIHLWHSSVRDFFVETELNIDMRDWEDDVEKQHYGVLQDLKVMFAPPNIKAGNYYKLDRGLSVSNMPFTKVSWGLMQDREYNPIKAETCYTYYPRRLQYSLPQQTFLKRDNWSAFLGNNFKDFSSNVTAIKAVSSTGLMLLFQNQAPGVYPGVDELQTKSGTTITIGDGGLFAREMQSYSNADRELEYGSCQSRRGVLNTPFGLFFISQEQGKIFKADKGLKELTIKSNAYWFNQYLPYQLTIDVPNFDLLDNPIAGIGCQAIYDNEWSFVYFCKRDFRIKKEWLEEGRLVYDIDLQIFIADGITKVETGDPRYFDDASWTVSFDAKSGEYISHHDWHPNLAMSGKNTFLTIKGDGVWRHNDRCDSYCNFYNKDYPFEIGFQVETTPAVVTVRNVEYFMQVFEFAENCRDRFHVLDFNFDEAIVYNSEQVSGLLQFTLEPKNNVKELVQYPIVELNAINILYSKEEQKYKFNQFWDVTKDRGEYSSANETIWYTQPNGYITDLNPNNLNYVKHEFQRKKFRHHNNKVLLRRTISGNKKMILLLSNTKLQNSPR